MPKVILKGYILVPTVDLEKIEKELVSHIKLTLEEKGCLEFKVTKDIDDKYKFDIHEEFSDQESFSSHQKRKKNQTGEKYR